MSNIVNIVGVAFMGGMLALIIKREKPEFAIMITLVTSVIITLSVVRGVGIVIEDVVTLIENCGVDIRYFTLCIKAVGLAYISQMSAEILRDGGENAIASKVEVAGKISILILVMPVLKAFIEMCVKVVKGI